MISKFENRAWWHYLLLLTGIICISWSAILVKLADVSGIASGFYRLFFATIGIIPIWLYFRKPITDKSGVIIAIICGILFACDIALWNTSIMISKATISTLLANLAPIWVGFGALLFMKEKPSKLFWIGTTIALTGVATIIGFDLLFSMKMNYGDLLAIIASMFYGAYILTVRKGRNTLDTFSFTAISMISSTVVMGILSIATQTELWGFSTKTWLSLAALGLIPQLLGWLAINFALGYIKPTIASVSLLSQTVFTAIFSIFVINEVLSFKELIGALIVLAGIFLVTRKGK